MSIDIVDQDVFTSLRSFLIAILPIGTEIVQAQDNQVPMPASGFVAMNNAGTRRLSTNYGSYTDSGTNPGSKGVMAALEYTIQLDFYGPNAAAWANITQVLFRDEYATASFPPNIQPLYADDPMQIPLIDAEAQYEQRWKLNAVLQMNPIVTVDQDFAGSLDIGLLNVDRTYTP